MRDVAEKPRTARVRSRAQTGFTLLEMLVSVAIFTVVVGAIYALLEVGRSDAFRTGQRAEMLQNARVALNTIEQDARNAGVGYWKGGARVPDGTLTKLLFLSAELDGAEDYLTPVVPGDGVCKIKVDGADVLTDAVTFAYQDNSFDDGHALAVTGVDPATNTVTVKPDNAPCNQGSLYVYLIDDGYLPALGSLMSLNGGNKLVFSAGDPLGINKPGGGGTFSTLKPSATLKRITWVTYFVKPDRTLVRREYGNTSQLAGDGLSGGGVGGVIPTGSGGGVGFVEMPLAYNVEDFQVQYVMTDGSVVDDVTSSVDPDTGRVVAASENRQNVRVVQVSLTVRSPQNDPRTKQPIRTTIRESFYTPNLTVPERPGGNAA